jgi:hypothetical protein
MRGALFARSFSRVDRLEMDTPQTMHALQASGDGQC